MANSKKKHPTKDLTDKNSKSKGLGKDEVVLSSEDDVIRSTSNGDETEEESVREDAVVLMNDSSNFSTGVETEKDLVRDEISSLDSNKEEGIDHKIGEGEGTNQKNEKLSLNEKMMIPFLDTFYQLSSEGSIRDRSIAARDLIQHCFFSLDGDINVKDAAYALTRLINGLCTGRAASRQGFASCLSSYLRTAHLHSVTKDGGDPYAILSSILQEDDIKSDPNPLNILRQKLISSTEFLKADKGMNKIKEIHSGGKLKGMNKRDHAFGRLFGILAVIRSGILYLSDTSQTVIQLLTKDLIELYGYKKWIREPASKALIELVISLDANVKESVINDIIVPRFFLNVNNELETELDLTNREKLIRLMTPEQIAVALNLQRTQCSKTYAFPLDEPILTSKSVPTLAPALASTSSVVYPRCHIVWNSLWMYLTEEVEDHRQLRKIQESDCDNSRIVESLMNHVVFDCLLGGDKGGSPTNERRSLALQIVSTLTGSSDLRIILPPNLITIIMSPQIVERVFLNVICASGGIGKKNGVLTDGSKEKLIVEHYLKPLTLTTLSTIVKYCSDSNYVERRMAFVKAFLLSDFRFDAKTKTPTVSSLLMIENREDVLSDGQKECQSSLLDKYLSFLEEEIVTSKSLHKATALIELMSKVAKFVQFKTPAEETQRVLRFFMTAAFFDCSELSIPNNAITSAKKRKKERGSTKSRDLSGPVLRDLSSAVRTNEILRTHGITSIPHPIRAIMSARFYSLLSDYISVLNARSRGVRQFNSNPEASSGPEIVYRVISDVWGMASTLATNGAKEYISDQSIVSSEERSATEVSKKNMLTVKKIADDAIVEESDSLGDSEISRAKSVCASSCASLMISLCLQVYCCTIVGDGDDTDDSNDVSEEIHECISDLTDFVTEFFAMIRNQGDPMEKDSQKNPLVTFTGLIVSIFSSSAGGHNAGGDNLGQASAAKLTRETAKLAWSGVVSLMCSLSDKGMISKCLVDQEVVDILLESVCGPSSSKDREDDESTEEGSAMDQEEIEDWDVLRASSTAKKDDRTEDDKTFPNGSSSNNQSDPDKREDENDEINLSLLEKIVLEDSDAEMDEDEVIEHHADADSALAQLIKLKQEARKASQSEREKIEFCNRLRCVALLDKLFSVSVLKSGMLPCQAVLGCIITILRSYKSISKGIAAADSMSSLAKKSINEKTSLLDRLSTLIKEKLSKLRVNNISETHKQSLLSTASIIYEEIKHSINLVHCSCCSIALITVIRCIPDTEKCVEVADIYSNAVLDWASRKGTKIHTCVFNDLIQRMPSLASVMLVEPLKRATEVARSAFLKCEVFKLLSFIYKQDVTKLTGDSSNSNSILSKTAQTALNANSKEFLSTLKNALSDSNLQKTKNKDEILLCTKHFINFSKSQPLSLSKSGLNSLEQVLREQISISKSNGKKKAFSQLADTVSELVKLVGKDSSKRSKKDRRHESSKKIKT